MTLRQVRRGRLGLGVAHGRLFADGILAYTAKDLRVGMINLCR